MLRSILIIAVFVPALLLAQDKAQTFSFIGVDACAPCHKTEKQGKQVEIWKNSQHSKAYITLQSEEANKIATEKGHGRPAIEVEDCLKCHVSGYNVGAEFLEKKFNIADGVQCETCHGPGSEYKPMKVMKNREEAIKKGLMVHDDVEKYCVTCHNEESPTFKGFNFEEYWAKIKHDIPE